MNTANKDILFLIAIKLSISDLLEWCISKKRIFESVYNNDNVWRNILSRDYPDYQKFNSETFSINLLSPKEAYIFLHKLKTFSDALNIEGSLYDIFLMDEIDLNEENLEEIPEINLPNLKYLDLRNNNLRKIPQLNLPNLKILDLEYNDLEEIPQLNLPNLEELTLSYNKLKRVPSFNLPNLRELDLHNNELTEVPPFDLPNLEKLFLFCNELKEVPLFDLPNLQLLNLGYNSLTEFPLFNLPNLEYLFLYDNQLKELPSFDIVDNFNLSKLKNLYLRNNCQIIEVPSTKFFPNLTFFDGVPLFYSP